MAPPRKIDQEELKKLLEKKVSVAKLAEQFGVSKARIYSLRNELFPEDVIHKSRKWAIPWVIRKEDHGSKVYQYLWRLAAYADGEDFETHLINTAIRWLRKELIAENLDLQYVRDNPEGERWVFFPADPNNWHAKMVYGRVLERAGVEPD